MDFHEAANLFPIDEDNLKALADDIRKNGQINPIELMDGKILDGRRRWSACQIAGVEPETTEVSPSDPVAYVLSINLHRRHLTPSQKSMVAARAREFYDREAKERQKRKPADSVPENLPEQKHDARDAAGKAVGVSGKSVDHATKVIKQGTPALVRAVDEGRMAVSTAAIHAAEPPEEQDRVANDPKRKRKYKPAIGGGAVDPTSTTEPSPDPPPGESRGVGVERAHEAIACLKRIPRSDGLRKRGFQIVLDYIRHNQRG